MTEPDGKKAERSAGPSPDRTPAGAAAPDTGRARDPARTGGAVQEGTILKGYSGFYYVACGDTLYTCSLRGKNRQKQVRFLPGDRVRFSVNGSTGAIEALLPRKNALLRPPVANLDQLLILAAICDPPPDWNLIDRLTVFAQWNGILPVLCFNKCDLAGAEQRRQADLYRDAGFRTVLTSTVTGEGIAEVKALLQGKVTVLAGNSGVGKSSLMNAVSDRWRLATGEVSGKLKRGRHTTRHVELFPLGENTFLADTPGFSSLTLPEDVSREELSRLFPEFLSRLGGCRFATCLHDSEPDCAVKAALARGEIAQSRYDNYRIFLREIIQRERTY